jgi:hypothetical protein
MLVEFIQHYYITELNHVTSCYLCGIKRARILDSDGWVALTMLVDLMPKNLLTLLNLMMLRNLPLRNEEGSNPRLRWMSCFDDGQQEAQVPAGQDP